MKRLQDLLATTINDASASPRRGLPGQKAQRILEQTVRGSIVDFSWWTAEQGWTLEETAKLLQMLPRTLRQWQHDGRLENRLLRPLGRHILRSPVHERNAVIDLLKELGPATGVPTLRECFPGMPRAELTDILARFRRIWRQRYQEAQHVLQWTVPGSVWAMDFSEASRPIDGIYPYLFAVRDLASGQQLWWLPVADMTAQVTVESLTSLFALFGAPLVLKSDNGPAFCADATRTLLDQFGVIPLFSPTYFPRYNGAIEAGIGSLKTRTEYHAARQGHPGYWTWDDVAAGQAQANATSRPRGFPGPTAEDLWHDRHPITAEERIRFQTTVERCQKEMQASFAGLDNPSTTTQDPRVSDRKLTQRALVEHGYLLFSRRRIPLPFPKKKVTFIS